MFLVLFVFFVLIVLLSIDVSHFLFVLFFFFFKQKTAYEMRISDWSSDVCSSDLKVGAFLRLDCCCPQCQLWPARSQAGHCCRRRRYDAPAQQIGRASCRERVCEYV